jgi:translation initiation factor 2 subunit 2
MATTVEEYTELINRVYEQLGETVNLKKKNQESKIHMPPPKLGIEGRSTLCVNFNDICQAIHRDPTLVRTYFEEELKVIIRDTSRGIILGGKFNTKHVESILKKYIREYVLCLTCKGINTELVKENRLEFLICKECSHRRTINKTT